MNSVTMPLAQQYIHPQVLMIAGCPCSPSAPFAKVSYRAVHANSLHPNNFLPKAVLEPQKLIGASPKNACSLWGLSMYDTPQALRDMVTRVESTVPNFRKKIGDQCAEMVLDASHGTRTHSNKSGHFDFYAFVTCNYHAQVVSVQPI